MYMSSLSPACLEALAARHHEAALLLHGKAGPPLICSCGHRRGKVAYRRKVFTPNYCLTSTRLQQKRKVDSGSGGDSEEEDDDDSGGFGGGWNGGNSGGGDDGPGDDGGRGSGIPFLWQAFLAMTVMEVCQPPCASALIHHWCCEAAADQSCLDVSLHRGEQAHCQCRLCQGGLPYVACRFMVHPVAWLPITCTYHTALSSQGC